MPSSVDSSFLSGKYSLSSSGMSLRLGGNPASMSAVRSWSSLDVAVLTLSSVMTNSVAVVSGEAVGFSDAEAISSLRISLLAGEAGF